MIRALFTWPYRSKRLRTDSSLALKSRLPTKIFFTQFSCQFESGAHAGRAHQRGRYDTLGRTRESYQTRYDYTTAPRLRAKTIEMGRVAKNTSDSTASISFNARRKRAA